MTLRLGVRDQELEGLVTLAPLQLRSGGELGVRVGGETEEGTDHFEVRAIYIVGVIAIYSNEMNAYKRRGGYLWAKKGRGRSEMERATVETDLDTFGSLKQEVKRIEIMTRMENRTKTSISGGRRRPGT